MAGSQPTAPEGLLDECPARALRRGRLGHLRHLATPPGRLLGRDGGEGRDFPRLHVPAQRPALEAPGGLCSLVPDVQAGGHLRDGRAQPGGGHGRQSHHVPRVPPVVLRAGRPDPASHPQHVQLLLPQVLRGHHRAGAAQALPRARRPRLVQGDHRPCQERPSDLAPRPPRWSAAAVCMSGRHVLEHHELHEGASEGSQQIPS
mmetsp:Transcript_123879/g.361768  ORF Transcript_123879/g.361768 Transcript_123879/m.361768 type:complete len:203 (+) Transcript_123879:594-1202(+)